MSSLRPQMLRIQVILLGVVVLAIIGVTVAALGKSAWTTVNDATRLDDHVSVDEDLGIFLVEKGDRVLALANRGPWNDEPVVYCPSSQLFETARSGSKFDVFGRYFYGPAPRGMTRYEVRVGDGDILVKISVPLPGPRRGTPVRMPAGSYCVPT